jgi:hypothetical protein
MQKAAQSSQPKSGNLGGGRVYAFRVSRINADFVCIKLWLLGGVIRARNIAVAALPDLIEQIDVALADGCEVIALDGAEFSAPEKVLSGIRNEFSSYCCMGASDANHVHGAGKAALPQSESLRSTKPKASAPATEQARQICKEELDGENHSSYRRAGSCGTINNAAIHCAKGGSDCTAPSASQVRSACGAGVAADISAIRAGLDEMRESQEDFFENLAALLVRIAEVLNGGGESAPKQPRGRQKCAVENPLGGVIRTKRGRTSVIVGVRKISTPKKQK